MPVSALSELSPDRRKPFADRILGLVESRRVFFASQKPTGGRSRGSEESQASYDELSFPRLRLLSLDYSARNLVRSITGHARQLLPLPGGYVVPSLQRLECCVEELQSGALQARLAEVRPHLRELLLRGKISLVTRRVWVPRLPELREFGPDSLEDVELSGRMEVTGAALAELASRTTLKRIMVDHEIGFLEGTVVDEAFAQMQRARVGDYSTPWFGALETLALKCDWRAIEALAQTGLPLLRQLVLSIDDGGGRVRLAALSKLR